MNKEEYQILTASWIMASNDENNLITYKSIAIRLGKDVSKVKKIINKHGELFRLGASKSAIDNWKSTMKNGKKRPRWIEELPESEKQLGIENLSSEDIFRSQFRANENSERSSIDTLDWGVRYLERIYTNESSESKTIIQYITLIFVFLSLILEIITACK